MRLAYRTVSFRDRPLVDAFSQIASIGYEGVEICMECHQLTRRTDEGELPSVLAAARSRGLVVSSLSDHRSLLDDRSFHEVLEEVKGATQVDVPVFIVSSAPRGEGRGLSDLVARMDSLLEASEGAMRIALEPEPGLLVEGSGDFVKLVNELGPGKDLCMNLDIGHAHCLGEDLEGVLRGFSRQIVHLHIEDISDMVHKHLVPGEGDMDFPKTLELVERWHPDKFVAVDLFDVPDALLAARRAMGFLGPIVGRLNHR